MRKIIDSTILLIIILFTTRCSSSAPLSHEVSIVPAVKSIKTNKGQFKWDKNTVILIEDENPDLRKNAEYLSAILKKTDLASKELAKKGKTENYLLLELDPSIDKEEAYKLDIDKNHITINAKNGKGIFYGIQSLLQMIPTEAISKNGLTEDFVLPAVSIYDAPRFPYRGMHMDVSRNFMTADNVKKYIDLMAMYKFNNLHWHLTDGAGWRIEVKKYPELTRKTAFRAQKNWKEFWNEGGRKFVDEGTPGAYGGYYTQDEIKDIVAYAKDRNITIIPEIEMPGHSEEVFVAYPELSCSGIPYKNSDFCAGNEHTFEFIEGVLDEVMDLFPSEYIHIGGDEAGKDAWKKCTKCQKRIKDENLKDVDELQSYFMKRVSNYLKKNGRKMIGWDEIIEGGLPKEAIVMLWRDTNTAIKAAEQGHDVIMTPGSYCYFDSYQANPATEPEAIGGYLPLKKVYSFEPVVNDSLAQYFIGGQGNTWAEYIPDYNHLEYMAFPRAIALAEVLWSPKNGRDWGAFKQRLFKQLSRLDSLDVNYHKPNFELDMFQIVDTINQDIIVRFESEQVNPEIVYTLDGSKPNANSTRYTDSIKISGAAKLAAAILKDNEPQTIFKKNVGYHKAIGKKVEYLKPWTSYPAGGETALTDGLIGGLTYGDGRWQGFTNDMEVIIDMGKRTPIESFSANFMQLTGPGVYMPEYVEVFGSNDKKDFKSLLKIENDIPKDHDRLIFKDFAGDIPKEEYQFIKVLAKNSKGFIFTDELIVN